MKSFPIPSSTQSPATTLLLPSYLHSFADVSQALEELCGYVISMGGEDDAEMGVMCVLLTSQSMVPLNLL